ncbi:helix-turn-helix domain-containing protein [Ruminococcaceae bacterium OttesenSCG-928-D13]|nr:helix-turn-helix domain-containing protein [Ruminococcaceae bacterium OttesenSCG-928-D13]
MSQCTRVLEYMQMHGGVTSLEAFTDLGIVSLPRRICDLRQQGHHIKVERVSGRNRYGEPTHYNRYRLEKETHQ